MGHPSHNIPQLYFQVEKYIRTALILITGEITCLPSEV
jgi:hypothetical protein